MLRRGEQSCFGSYAEIQLDLHRPELTLPSSAAPYPQPGRRKSGKA